MKIPFHLLEEIRKSSPGYWGERITAQIAYGIELSKVQDHSYDELLSTVLEYVYNQFKAEGAVTNAAAFQAEALLLPLQEVAKKHKLLCAAHAHIDMNWMWRWDETVAVTLDTFRTMLDLMKEYPQFTFSQSQASVYKIVEDFDTNMLNEIKNRIKEGRWEVTASTWVEGDKNLPNGESMARHILYTKKYLAKLLNISPDSLQLDFEPDTFGHNANVPEILSKGGVKYYYHCRGYEGHSLYRWSAPSGESIVVYREPLWYNAEINSSIALYVPQFCTLYGMDTMLKVYGVGDHGGGPTRRDIERLNDMNTWPVFPEIRFGTFHEYFSLVEKAEKALPEVEGELNFVFSGCYTTQTRIKMANRIGEATLQEAEAFASAAALHTGYPYDNKKFREAWKNILFNQFHDIIPGSGVVDTREYAMGLFQSTMAAANTERNKALRSITSKIDTSRYLGPAEDIRETISEGAGAGFGIDGFKVTQAERGRGKTRIFHVFNPAAFGREEVVELTVWDWNYDKRYISFEDGAGVPVEFQVVENGFSHYWGHSYLNIFLKAKVPALGYATYIMTEKKEKDLLIPFPRDPRVEHSISYVLENEYVKATFDNKNAALLSFIYKSTGEELINKAYPAVFRLIEEDDSKGMTAWTVGRYMSSKNLTEDVKIRGIHNDCQALRQSFTYDITFNSSRLKVIVSLDKHSKTLNYTVECHWLEVGKPGKYIPQLNYYLPFGYCCSTYKYDIPFGTIERLALDMDVPGNSWALGMNEAAQNNSLMLVTQTKYGFRGYENALSLTLIRSSFDPDPYPELGVHKFNFGVSVADTAPNKAYIEHSYCYNHPLSVLSSTAQSGTMPLSDSYFELVEGNAAISAVKAAEDTSNSNSFIVRLHETEGTASMVTLRCSKPVKGASFVDINERPLDIDSEIVIKGDEVIFEIGGYSIASICLEF